jgi:hypothetical protein
MVSFSFGIFMSTGTSIDGFSVKMTKLVLEDFFDDIYVHFYKTPLNFIRGIKPEVQEAYL